MPAEQYPNSYAGVVGGLRAPDTTLDLVDYHPGDGVLKVASCPAGALATGPVFRVKVGTNLYKITSLGAGNIVWAIPDGPVESTGPDQTHLIGTGVYLEFTRASVEAIRAASFVTVNDETVNGFPNSVQQDTVGEDLFLATVCS